MHCVLNEDFQTGIVCSVWKAIPAGRCPRYLEQRNGIDDFACIGSDLCPRGQYNSYEVYKYPACLNSSLYITEPTTTLADTTEQPSTCRDCADGGSTGSTTHTETTTKSTLPTDCNCDIYSESSKSTTCTETTSKSTLPTDSKCDVVSESSKQSMSCAVPIVITVIVLMTISCLLIVLEYRTGKFFLGVICGCLKNGSCGQSTTGTQQVPQGQAELHVPAQGQLMSVQGSAPGLDHQHQQV